MPKSLRSPPGSQDVLTLATRSGRLLNLYFFQCLATNYLSNSGRESLIYLLNVGHLFELVGDAHPFLFQRFVLQTRRILLGTDDFTTTTFGIDDDLAGWTQCLYVVPRTNLQLFRTYTV